MHRGKSRLVYLLVLFLQVSKNSSGNGFGMFITAENFFPMLRPHGGAASPREFLPVGTEDGLMYFY